MRFLFGFQTILCVIITGDITFLDILPNQSLTLQWFSWVPLMRSIRVYAHFFHIVLQFFHPNWLKNIVPTQLPGMYVENPLTICHFIPWFFILYYLALFANATQYNFPVSKPGRRHFNKVTKFNITSNQINQHHIPPDKLCWERQDILGSILAKNAETESNHEEI